MYPFTLRACRVRVSRSLFFHHHTTRSLSLPFRAPVVLARPPSPSCRASRSFRLLVHDAGDARSRASMYGVSQSYIDEYRVARKGAIVGDDNRRTGNVNDIERSSSVDV